MGLTFGILGFMFALPALGLVVNLRKEFEDLKKNLKNSSVLKEQAEPEDK